MLHAQGDHAADMVIVEGVVHGLALAAELYELAGFQQPNGAPWKILVHEPSMIKEVVFDFPEEEFRKMLADNAMILPGEPGFTPITD